MTRTQFRRMCSFALRMVPIAIGGTRWKAVLRDHVREILYRMNCENFSIHYSHVVNWDHNTRLPGDDGTCGFALDDARSLLCDYVSGYCFDHGLEREVEDRHGNCRLVDTKIGIALHCCLRAACDFAAQPQSGVLGFTVGELRQMWAPKPIPEWVSSQFDADFHALSDTIPVLL